MRIRLLVVLLGMLAPLAFPSAASAAAPTFHETFKDVFYAPNEDEGPIECKVGSTVVATFTEDSAFHGNDLVKPVPGSNGQAFFGHFNYSFRAEHVNRANGESFSVKIEGVFRELTAELLTAPLASYPPVYDEDGQVITLIGPVYRFTAVEVAHLMIWDDDGKLVSNERGRILWDAVFDTRGDSEPGGVLVSEQDPVVLSGTFPFPDFCDMALELTT